MAVKLLSSLEKCFWDEDLSSKEAYTHATCLANERFHFIAAYQQEGRDRWHPLSLEIVSPLKECICVQKVEQIPVHAPCWEPDDNYLRTTPGLYPDLLLPLSQHNRIPSGYHVDSLFIEVDPAGKFPAGTYPIELRFSYFDGEPIETVTFQLEIIGAELPPQKLIHTEWFHCDCLQDYYRTDSFDERHWQIIENFMSTAAKRGINMILTPRFHPSPGYLYRR